MSAFWDTLTALTGDPSALAGDVAGAASSGTGFLGSITSFFSTVTDGKMWRSFGWILLGVIILGLGLALLLRKTVEGAVGSVAKAVAL